VEFLWKCHDLDKGKKCPKNYRHVGKGCFSCKKFYDEKMIYGPETTLDEKELKRFMDDLLEYRGWLDSMRGKNVRFAGTVDSIMPHLKMTVDDGQNRVHMDGFYVSFDRGYFHNNLFNDRIYLRVDGRFLFRTEVAPGDDLEFDAVFTEERGRIILKNPKKTEIKKNGGKECITPSRARVARATGKIIAGSIEKCKDCAYCSLIDMEDRSRKGITHYRRFYCLRGISDSENCVVRIEEIIETEKKRIRF